MNKIKLAYTVDDRPYSTEDQFMTGKQIKDQAGVPANYDLYLVIPQFEDELIENGKTVNMARPGVERFVTRPPHHTQEIIVNAMRKPYPAAVISYEEVVVLAFGKIEPGHEYSVSYTDGDPRNPSGQLLRGKKVFVKHNMKFNVTGTHLS